MSNMSTAIFMALILFVVMTTISVVASFNLIIALVICMWIAGFFGVAFHGKMEGMDNDDA